MPTFFEPLESRTLMSALPPQAATITADVTAIGTDLKTVHVAINQCATALPHDLRSLAADLRHNRSSQNVQLLATLEGDARGCVGTLRRDFGALVHVALQDARRVRADSLRLLRHPSDAAAGGRLTADLTQLQIDTAAINLDQDAASCQTTEDQDLATIAAVNAGNAALQNGVARAQTNSNRTVQAIESAFNSLQNDVAALVTDATIT